MDELLARAQGKAARHERARSLGREARVELLSVAVISAGRHAVLTATESGEDPESGEDQAEIRRRPSLNTQEITREAFEIAAGYFNQKGFDANSYSLRAEFGTSMDTDELLGDIQELVIRWG